jgi:hypothetical protein
MNEREKARLSEALLKAARETTATPDMPPPSINMAALATPDACVGQVAKECIPRQAPNPLEVRGRLLAAYVAIRAVRDDFNDYRAYEDRQTFERHIAARLGELELTGR